MIVLAWILAFLARFDFMLTPDRQDQLIATLPYVVLLKIAAPGLMWVHRDSWPYVGIRDVVSVVRAMYAVTLLLISVRVVAEVFLSTGGRGETRSCRGATSRATTSRSPPWACWRCGSSVG